MTPDKDLREAARQAFQLGGVDKDRKIAVIKAMRWAFLIGYRIAEAKERHTDFATNEELQKEWAELVMGQLVQASPVDEWRQ